MRKVIASEFVSLDGVLEDPSWTFQFGSEEQEKFKSAELTAADALLLGRTTYEEFAAAWPNMMEQYEGPSRAELQEFADMMNGYPKHVVSTTLQEPLEWNNSTDRRKCRRGSVKRQAAARQGHPGLRQRRPCQHADETWPRRRVPAHGLSHCLGKRETSLRGWTRHHRSGTRGYEGVRLGRRSPHLPACRRVGRPSRAVAGATTPGSSMRHNRGEGRRRRRCARKICEKEVWQ
jgi:hypothetical protein